MSELSHVDETGRLRMVDVGGKEVSRRRATARARVRMAPATAARLRALPKGDALAAAELAGIMAAKRTHELIPMCHPLLITDVIVDFETMSEGSEGEPARVGITGTAKNVGKTGVEMEALVAVTTAALTIYDMAKAVDRAMRIENVRLVLKRGGKSGEIKPR